LNEDGAPYLINPTVSLDYSLGLDSLEWSGASYHITRPRSRCRRS